jgi:hypothetical protein
MCIIKLGQIANPKPSRNQGPGEVALRGIFKFMPRLLFEWKSDFLSFIQCLFSKVYIGYN